MTSIPTDEPSQGEPEARLPGLYGVAYQNVVEVNTDPVFAANLAKCEECDWRPPDLGTRPELASQEHTAQTGHMTAIPIAEYIYYMRDDEPQA